MEKSIMVMVPWPLLIAIAVLCFLIGACVVLVMVIDVKIDRNEQEILYLDRIQRRTKSSIEMISKKIEDAEPGVTGVTRVYLNDEELLAMEPNVFSSLRKKYRIEAVVRFHVKKP